MIIAKVIGHVIATRKNEKLLGSKFLIAEPFDGFSDRGRLVAVDNVGAGIGEIVLIATGSAAREGDVKNSPIDALVIGIVDDPTKIVIEE